VNHGLFAGLIALPFGASANPIPDTKTVVDVEVWGTIYEVNVGDKWAINDPLYRKLTIDLSLAPPDRTDGPITGRYMWNETGCEPFCPPRVPAPSGFIRTSGWTFEGISEDSLEIADIHGRGPGLNDLYAVGDGEYQLDATGLVNQQTSFYAVINSPNYDYLNGGAIAQSFDVTVNDFFGARGGIGEWIGDVRNHALFYITRMRSTPRVCKP
jgi:hypothetical protein